MEYQQGRTEHRHQRLEQQLAADEPEESEKEYASGNDKSRPEPFRQDGEPGSHFTVIRSFLEEEADHRDEQQEIPAIGDSYAPGIVGNGKDAPLEVLVVVSLIETEPSIFEDMVHGDGERLPGREYRHLAPVVHGSAGVGITLYGELVQPQGERQFHSRAVLKFDLAAFFSGTQADAAADTRQMGDQGAGQDQDKGDMQQEGENTLVATLVNKIRHAADGHDSPEYEEKRTVIEVAERIIGSTKLFKDRGSHHHDDDGCQRPIAQVLGCFLHTISVTMA